jgi:aminoglycoside phosphotransferase (APT) family kinase protein
MARPVRQMIDVSSLENYLNQVVPEIESPLDVKQVKRLICIGEKAHGEYTDSVKLQFTSGQSNPTYQLTAVNGKRYVLRKKPPGRLPEKTHQIEREYEIINALQGTNLPLPKMYCLCLDSSIIGTSFYIMEFLQGRIFSDSTMPNVSPRERSALYVSSPNGPRPYYVNFYQ